ncbi:MAG TPA: hypothetical protein DCY13_20540 [Verrucomicrobiales bacterium]|nr:hypothetical protein [Verrucomicrobiales bacterium]
MNTLKFALRQLIKHPGFTTVAVLALGLGIAVNTAMFTLANALLWRPVPGIPEPEGLVQLGRSFNGEGFGTMAHGDLQLFREHSRTLESVAARFGLALGLGHEGSSERIDGALVSASYFEVLGISMALGRSFEPIDDTRLGANPAVVLSHGLWQRRFAGDPAILGRTITLNGQSLTVVGVAPEGFTGGERFGRTEAWVPLAMVDALGAMEDAARLMASTEAVWLRAVGRLKPGVSIEQAEGELSGLLRQQPQQPSPDGTELGIRLAAGLGIDPNERSEVVQVSVLLQAFVALVLLIGCANVANLQIVRGMRRVRELGIRFALGASRWQVIRQLFAENALLAAMAAVVGLLLGWWFTPVVAALTGDRIPAEAAGLAPDARVIGFAALLAVVAAMVTGLLPAWRSVRGEVFETLKETSAQGGSGRSRLRDGFVVAQIALSMLLLVGAGLFLRSLGAMLNVKPGYNPENVVIANIDVGLNGYDEQRGRQYFESLLERLREVPGVRTAALAPFSPFNRAAFGAPAEVADPAGGAPRQLQTSFTHVSPDFFATLEMPLVAGRPFQQQDRSGSAAVAIVDEGTAKQLWPDQVAVGQTLRLAGMDGWRTLEVVGVVREARYRDLTFQADRTVYLPFDQNYQSWMTLLVRTESSPEAMIRTLHQEAAAIDASVPLHQIRTLVQQREDSLWQQRLMVNLMGGFALLALALATLGIYGVMSHNVAQRTRELGVRIALGAARRDVLGLILKQGSRLALLGVGVGLVLSLGLSRLIASRLFGIGAHDPLTHAAILVLLMGAALLACWLPARRAARVDPLVALRAE